MDDKHGSILGWGFARIARDVSRFLGFFGGFEFHQVGRAYFLSLLTIGRVILVGLGRADIFIIHCH